MIDTNGKLIRVSCPNCHFSSLDRRGEQDIECPSCGITIHWQGSTPWIDTELVHSCGYALKKLSDNWAYYDGKLWTQWHCPYCGVTVGLHKDTQKDMDFVETNLQEIIDEILPY